MNGETRPPRRARRPDPTTRPRLCSLSVRKPRRLRLCKSMFVFWKLCIHLMSNNTRLCKHCPRNHRPPRHWTAFCILSRKHMGYNGSPTSIHSRSMTPRSGLLAVTDMSCRIDVISAMLDPASVPSIDMPHLRDLCSHGIYVDHVSMVYR